MVDVREKLLQSSRSLPDFPDETNLKLMEFSYIGKLQTSDGTIYVAIMDAVLSGMKSPPGGLGKIMFFNDSFSPIGSLPSSRYPPTAFCKGGILFFRRRSHSLPTNSGGQINNGNGLDLSQGWKQRQMVDVYEYGSSGGIQDRVPNDFFRAREKREWDGKVDLVPTENELHSLPR